MIKSISFIVLTQFFHFNELKISLKTVKPTIYIYFFYSGSTLLESLLHRVGDLKCTFFQVIGPFPRKKGTVTYGISEKGTVTYGISETFCKCFL